MAPRRAAPCVFYLRGHCRRGDYCAYTHAPAADLHHTLPFADRQFSEARPSSSQSGASDSSSASASNCTLVRVMSYNILADHLAHDHALELYTSAPQFALEWAYRRDLIVREVAEYAPHVVCLQEVDHFRQMREALAHLGYDGVYTQRTGDRRDGLATFWRRDAFTPLLRDSIQFASLGLRDNVAQVVVLAHASGAGAAPGTESSAGGGGTTDRSPPESGEGIEPASAGGHTRFGGRAGDSDPEEEAIPPGRRRRSRSGHRGGGGGDGGAPALVVANIHVLFNPRRGDVKLAQVRTLLEAVHVVGRKQGAGAPAVICGDFNSAASSPIYRFVADGCLPLLAQDRKRMSGQVEGQGKGWPALRSSFLAEVRRQEAAEGQHPRAAASDALRHQQPGAAEAAALGAVMSSYPPYSSLTDPHSSLADPRLFPGDRQASGNWRAQPLTPPYAPEPGPAGWDTPPGSRPQRKWTHEELEVALGPAAFGRAAEAGLQEQRQQQEQQAQRGQRGRGRGQPPPPPALDEAACVATHPLSVRSAYASMSGEEPVYTTCHDKFIGTVDYIWYTPHGTARASADQAACGSSGSQDGAAPPLRLEPVRVLRPPPLQSLLTGLPCGAWPSDHISLVADFFLRN